MAYIFVSYIYDLAFNCLTAPAVQVSLSFHDHRITHGS